MANTTIENLIRVLKRTGFDAAPCQCRATGERCVGCDVRLAIALAEAEVKKEADRG